MLPDLVYKFQIICLRGSKVIEWKPDIFVFFGKTRDITAEQEKISKVQNQTWAVFWSSWPCV